MPKLTHWSTILMAVAFGAPAASAQAQDPAPLPRPAPLPSFVTDGPVEAFASAGDRLFVGGDFSRIGPQTGGFGAVNQSDGGRVARLPQVAGAVYVTVPDGVGGLYIGGAFGLVGGVPRSNLAHVLADGSVDPTFDPAPDGTIFGLAKVGDRLFVGGNFVRMGTVIRRRLAAVQLPTGTLDEQFNPGVDGPVGDLLPVGDKLLVNGSFRGIAGTSRRGFAAIDQVEGRLAPGYDVTPDGTVDVMHQLGDRVYIGGGFSTVNGRSRSGLAALDAETGTVDESFAPSVNGRVTALADDGERLYVGGAFTEISQTFDNGVASLDPQTGRASAEFRFFAQGTVSSIAIVGDEIFFGGNFFKVNEVPIGRLAVADRRTGAVRPTFAPDPNGDVYTLLAQGGELIVGGTFSSVPRAPAGRLAALDATTGVADLSFAANIDGPVRALAVDGTRLLVGGDFKTVNTQPRARLADVDGATGAVGGLSVPIAGGIRALAADGEHVYAGGDIGDDRHWGLVRITNGQLDDAFNLRRPTATQRTKRPPLVDRFGSVNALALAGDRLYVGGNFTAPRGSDNLLAVDTGSAAAVGDFDSKVQGGPAALALDGDTLYVTGQGVQRFRRFIFLENRGSRPPEFRATGRFVGFLLGERVDGELTKRIGRGILDYVGYEYQDNLFAVDAGSGALRRGFLPKVGGGGDAVATSGGTVFAGGVFGRLNDLRIDNLGAFDTGGALVPGYTPEPVSGALYGGQPTGNGGVSALHVAGGRLYAGGSFNQVGFLPQAFLAAFPLGPTR